MAEHKFSIPTRDGNFVIRVEHVVDVGKEMIREAVARSTRDKVSPALREIADAVDVMEAAEARNAPRRPQVGDFWETADGSKVYVEGRIESNNKLAVVFVVAAVSKRTDYAANTDGSYTSVSGGSHPLDLKRFIGR